VKEPFKAQQLETWPDTVHWIILTFAGEAQLDDAGFQVQTTFQTSTEIVRQFCLGLKRDAAALVSLIDTMEVKSLFAQGIREPSSSLFDSHQTAA
jgi:hypothetical protein